jgi:hypothetical protein
MELIRPWVKPWVLVEAAPVDYFKPIPATLFTRRLKACRQATEKPAVVPRAKA